MTKPAFAMLVASLSFAAAPVSAGVVDQKVHKLCIEAKDYAGCVRAMNGDTTPSSRTITQQGGDIPDGNQCTAVFAYIGGGNCQDVRSIYPSSDLGHDSLIAGKKDKDGKDVWGCKYNWLRGAGELRLSGAVTRTTNNPACPSGEPVLGYNSTCQTAPHEPLRP